MLVAMKLLRLLCFEAAVACSGSLWSWLWNLHRAHSLGWMRGRVRHKGACPNGMDISSEENELQIFRLFIKLSDHEDYKKMYISHSCQH